MITIGILYAEMATTFNLCENIRINQEREEFESLRSEMRYYMRKEQERAKQNLISQNASKEENKEEEERKGIPVVPPLQIDEDGIALGKVSLTNFNKKPQ